MSTAPVATEVRASVTELHLRSATIAVRPALLMCAPTLYEVDYVINPWMAGNVHASSRERATEQWQRLYEAVSSLADIQLIDPQPGSPDMVFTANAGLERDGMVVLSSFYHPERQDEEQHFRSWFSKAGYLVIDGPRETPFEGEGDALFSVDGERLWVGHGPRTLIESHRRLRDVWAVEVVSLHLTDPRFYHLDTCFAPLADGFVLYYPGAFDETSLKKIETYYPFEKRIVVGETDAIRFACNAINFGQTLILNTISDQLCNELQEKGFQPIQVDLSEFLKAGGAAKCLVMKLSPTRR